MAWLLLLFIVPLAGYWLGWRLPHRILVPARRVVNLTPTDLGFTYEELELTTSDGLVLAAWFVPAERAFTNLILLHGNGSAKELYLEYLPRLIPAGVNVLLLDQRAHGRSAGRYHTFGAREWRDVEAAVHFLDTENNLSIGVFGHSMGGAVALSALGSKEPGGGARVPGLHYGIVESSFASFAEVTHAFARRMSGLPLPTFLTRLLLLRAGRLADFDPFAVVPEERAATVRAPTMIVHGTADERIPATDGKRLYTALATVTKELYLVEGAGHDDVCGAGGAEYWRRLIAFVKAVG